MGKESESKSELALCLYALEKVIPSIRSLILRMREFEPCELWELFDPMTLSLGALILEMQVGLPLW